MIRHYDFGNRWKTHKGIGVEEIVADAQANGINTISVVSSGNYLGAILEATRDTGLRVVNLVNWPLESKCEEVLIPPRRILRDASEREKHVSAELVDAGKVRDYTDFISEGLKERAAEIVATGPEFIGVGLGSGKLWLALEEAIVSQGARTKLIGVVPRGENGIFNEGNLEVVDGTMIYHAYNPTSIADKLSTPYTSYKPQIVNAMQRGHKVIEVENPDFRKALKIARGKGFAAEASGAAGFVLYDEGIRERCGITEESEVLVISTGNGSKKNVNLLRLRRMAARSALAILPLALAYGGHTGLKAYKNYSAVRSVAAGMATDAARSLGEEINVGNMSNEELFDYSSSKRVKDKMGGPPWYQ